ncbi:MULTISPECIES: hypothetical protein [unclassified Cupriavidus]|uniref:hypothetical protein n=1 Tax=unclassified Cupriavidus TaxID=2640874 RepID=UPI0010F9FF93|nr:MULTISPECIES: hypothetical protein [unclassified Cupriavidus]MWL90630.1 hypothetical protein [Cupriavidus sp. SW-Y-13]
MVARKFMARHAVNPGAAAAPHAGYPRCRGARRGGIAKYDNLVNYLDTDLKKTKWHFATDCNTFQTLRLACARLPSPGPTFSAMRPWRDDDERKTGIH